jgi:tetratricopeptide (TPR) repeat protein
VNLGLAYHSLSEYELAVRHLTKALRARSNLLAANVIVGMDYAKIGSPEKALPFLQRALKLDPSNREARQALASAYLGQENFHAAAQEFAQIAALETDKSEAWFRLGHEYLDLSARLAYRGAHLYPESAWGHRFLGDLLFQRTRWDEAVREYQKALTADPKQAGLHTSVGETYLHASKFQEADAEFQKELKLDSNYEGAWLGLAESALKLAQANVALKDIRKVWEISPDFLSSRRDFPTVELSPDEAEALIEGLKPQLQDPCKDFLLANLYAVVSDPRSESHWNAFEAALKRNEEQNHHSRSAQDPCKSHSYTACANSFPKQEQLTNSQRLTLARARFILHNYDDAAEALAQVKGTAKENAEASYWLALSYRLLGTEAYARLQEAFPDSWRAHQLRSEGFALRQDLNNAIKEFQAALQLRPNEPELHEAIGEAYLDRHSEEDAQVELRKALDLDSSRTRALYLLGRLYVQRRENDKALPYLQRALRLQPDLSEASSLLGTAYVRLGQFTNAVPPLEKAAAFDHYGNVHYQLYLAYKKLGRTGLAEKALARSQELRRSSLEHDQALIMGTPQLDGNPE